MRAVDAIDPRGVYTVDHAWFHLIAELSQTFAGDIGGADSGAIRLAADKFLLTLPPPRDRIHNLFLDAILAAAAYQICESTHSIVNRDDRCDCRHLSTRFLRTRGCWPHLDAIQCCKDWVEQFFSMFVRSHRPAPEIVAARLLRGHPGWTWAYSNLSHEVGLGIRQLNRTFVGRYGMTIKHYHHLARLELGLQRIEAPTSKVEVVALELGYRSKKDFYRIMQQVVGMTPSKYRRLPAEDRAGIARRIREQLHDRARGRLDP